MTASSTACSRAHASGSTRVQNLAVSSMSERSLLAEEHRRCHATETQALGNRAGASVQGQSAEAEGRQAHMRGHKMRHSQPDGPIAEGRHCRAAADQQERVDQQHVRPALPAYRQ